MCLFLRTKLCEVSNIILMSFGQGVKLTTKKPTQVTVKSTGIVSFLPISKLSTSIFKLAK